jgi:hypothetical protein
MARVILNRTRLISLQKCRDLESVGGLRCRPWIIAHKQTEVIYAC